MRKNHKKYNIWLGDNDYDARRVKLISADPIYPQQQQERDGKEIPKEMLLCIRGSPGFFLGLPSGPGGGYVGVPQGAEGNMLVVGGNGSGKSAGVAKPTLRTWGAAICATDVKGELSDCYEKLYRKGLVTRPYIIFDPTQPDGPSYDPFWWLSQDDSHNLVNNVQELALAIIPIRPDEKDPFWTDTKRSVLEAALLYYFQLGISFSETMCVISGQSLSSLCKELTKSDDSQMQKILGEMADMKG